MIVGSNELLHKQAAAEVRPIGIVLALGIALLISIYSILDGLAVQLTPATPYTLVMLGLSGLFFTPFALRGNGWGKMFAVGRAYWQRILVIGVAGLLAYGIVLNVYAMAPVSYAGAIESIVFALAGWKPLGEPMGRAVIDHQIFDFADRYRLTRPGF
jgi:hypothetical protein